MAILSCSASTADLPSSACPWLMQRLRMAGSDTAWSRVVVVPLGCENALLPQWASRSCLAMCGDPRALPSHWEPNDLKAVQKEDHVGQSMLLLWILLLLFITVTLGDLAFPYMKMV